MTDHLTTLHATARATAELDQRRAIVLAARDEAILEARRQGVSVAVIADAAGVAETIVRRVLAAEEKAAAAPPPGPEPSLDPGDGEFMWDDTAEKYVDNTEPLSDVLSTVVEDYGITPDDARAIAEGIVDLRVVEIDQAEAQAIRHAAWEAVRDPDAGRVELRRLRAWRFHHPGDPASSELVEAARQAGARTADVRAAVEVGEGRP